MTSYVAASRLFAVARQFLQLVRDPRRRDVGQEHGQGDQAGLALAVAFDDERLAGIGDPIEDLARPRAKLGHGEQPKVEVKVLSHIYGQCLISGPGQLPVCW